MKRIEESLIKLMEEAPMPLTREHVILVGQIVAYLMLTGSQMKAEPSTYRSSGYQRDPIRFDPLPAFGRVAEEYPEAFETRVAPKQVDRSWVDSVVQLIASAIERDLIEYSEVMRWIWGNLDESFLFFSVPEMILDIAGPGAGESIYCPFEGTTPIALEAAKRNNAVYTESAIDDRFFPLANILGSYEIHHHNSDPIRNPSWLDNESLSKFDVGVAIPPFGVRYKKGELDDWYSRFPEQTFYGEVLYARHLLAQTSGRAIIAVPNSLLFRTSAGEREFKQSIIESGILRAVIDTSDFVLFSRSTLQNISLLVFDLSEKNTDVIFIKLDKRPDPKALRNAVWGSNSSKMSFSEAMQSRTVSSTDISSNNFNLIVDRYIIQASTLLAQSVLTKSETVKLEDIAKLIRPQSLKLKGIEEGYPHRELLVGDIPEFGYIGGSGREIFVPEKLSNRARKQLLKPGDVLLSIKGTIGTVGLVPDDLQGNWVAGQSILIIRLTPDSMIDGRALYMYLLSEVAQELLKHRAGGSVIQAIQTRDIRSFLVPLMDGPEQDAVIQNFEKGLELQEQIIDYKARLDALPDQHWSLFDETA